MESTPSIPSGRGSTTIGSATERHSGHPVSYVGADGERRTVNSLSSQDVAYRVAPSAVPPPDVVRGHSTRPLGERSVSHAVPHMEFEPLDSIKIEGSH
ncbi:hypothetical protein ElyMa_006929800, partial [Elysia marginata]